MDMDLLSLKLHVDDKDSVWYVVGDNPPVATGMGIIPFMLQPVLRKSTCVRLIGTLENTHLILALYGQQLHGEKALIEICSPLVCQTANELHDPKHALYAMRQYDKAVSLGGWHEVNQGDYFAYALVNHIHKVGGIDDQALRLLRSHPAWPALSFIPHLNRSACIFLLAMIVDPRWYIDPMSPGRGSKLRSYLGLNPQTMLGVLGTASRNRYYDRCKMAAEAWNGQKDLKNIEEPNYFLYRVFRSAGINKGPLYAGLRTTQYFIEFLRLTWLAALAPNTQLESLFVPEYFFKSKEEAQAFRDHMKSE